MSKKSCVLLFNAISLACMVTAYAAKPIDLQKESATIISTFIAPQRLQGANTLQTSLKQIRSESDFNRTAHIRVQQTVNGYPVFGGDAVIHVPQGGNMTLTNFMAKPDTTMNGIVYQDLQKDLANTPAYVFNNTQKENALAEAVKLYQEKNGKVTVSQHKSDLMVYVDKNNKAHWVFLVSYFAKPARGMVAKPTYLMDAMSFEVYKYWNDLRTAEEAAGGGFGGNERMGKISYDGLKNDLPQLTIEHDETKKLCYLENDEVTVINAANNDLVAQFSCEKVDSHHNNEYWDEDLGDVNGGYSPENDALYVGKIVQEMYKNWYSTPALAKDGKPMMLTMRVHVPDGDGPMENAYWDGEKMNFGDGAEIFYPLVSLGVGAHEISHGFTEQHSNLQYMGQSGGLNESFSDMAAQAAEFYAYGKSSWQIGAEIFKAKDRALRYMDDPTKDCYGKTPGEGCSITHMKDYSDTLNVHFTSGIYNKVFYLMSTAPSWDTKKAFNVMVKANKNYWTSTTTFAEAACGVLKATQDYKYDLSVVNKAMSDVGIDVSVCNKRHVI